MTGPGPEAGGLAGKIDQLIALTQQTLQVQQTQQATLSEANRQRGQAKNQGIPSPLPIRGTAAWIPDR